MPYKNTLYSLSTTTILVCTNLMVQLSRIYGHEIHVVSYACIDSDLSFCIEADYVVYILMRLPPD
jgi:hypothetical protein